MHSIGASGGSACRRYRAMRTRHPKRLRPMLKSLFRRFLAAFGLSIALAMPAAAGPSPPPVAHPALWAIADADTTVYLFGTIHLLPENYRWRSAKLDNAVTGSQQLMVETIVDEKN